MADDTARDKFFDAIRPTEPAFVALVEYCKARRNQMAETLLRTKTEDDQVIRGRAQFADELVRLVADKAEKMKGARDDHAE